MRSVANNDDGRRGHMRSPNYRTSLSICAHRFAREPTCSTRRHPLASTVRRSVGRVAESIDSSKSLPPLVNRLVFVTEGSCLQVRGRNRPSRIKQRGRRAHDCAAHSRSQQARRYVLPSRLWVLVARGLDCSRAIAAVLTRGAPRETGCPLSCYHPGIGVRY